MACEALFPTPLWSWQHPDPAEVEAAASRILALEAADPVGIQRTNQGGWHSSVLLLQDSQLSDLFAWIASAVQEALVTWGWDLDQARPVFTNAWAMVNREGHSAGAHLHPNSLFSGVIYLRAPAGSGAIAFLDPRAGAQMLQLPLQPGPARRELGRERRVPRPGLMLMFPAWLWHEVEPSECQEPRICISFNVGLRPFQAPRGGRR